MTAEILRPIDLSGTHAYAEKSVFAGDLVNFRISSDADYRLAVYRLGSNPESTSGDVRVAPEVSGFALKQPIYPGSYVEAARPLDSDLALTGLTLECWIRPWNLLKRQGLISQHSYPNSCGFGLFLDPNGAAAFYTGDGGTFDPAGGLIAPSSVGVPKEWVHLAAVWDGSTKAIWVNGEEKVSEPFSQTVRPGPAPLRLAADGDLVDDVPTTVNLFEGDLAMPAIYERALSPGEIFERAGQEPPELPSPLGLLAAWPLDEERGERVRDIGPGGHHGRIVNRGTWMIGGPGFMAENVPLYSDYDPKRDPKRGHALRFASDDLYDCGWAVTHSIRIPEDARPGLYVGRISREDGSIDPAIYDVTFVVKRAPSQPQADMVVLCATNTWMAYNSMPFAKNSCGIDDRHWDPGGVTKVPALPGVEDEDCVLGGAVPGGAVHADSPQYSMYRPHANPIPNDSDPPESLDGQPAFAVGTEMPWPAAAPYVRYNRIQEPRVSFGYGHLVRADRYFQLWLDREGYDYDVVTDWDLDHCPELLGSYKVLVINGHSEYWSARAYHGVDRFLSRGGKVMVLSGNTMCWRVSFDPAGTVMECRKTGDSIGEQTDWPGEVWHSQDGERGGLMRTCGMPAYQILGMDFGGAFGRTQEDFQPFTVVDAGHRFFSGTGLQTGDEFGLAPSTEDPDEFLPRAVGHESDTRLGNLPVASPIPPGAVAPVEPPGIETLAENTVGNRQSPKLLNWFGNSLFTPPQDTIAGQMIYWDRPRGGSVFYAGAVACGWTLLKDEVFGQVIHNALEDFGIQKAPLRFRDVTAGIFQDQLFVFARDRETKEILVKRRTGNSWDPVSSGENLGGHLAFPAVTLEIPGVQLNAFAVGEDGSINNRWWTGTWHGDGGLWQRLATGMVGPPAAALQPNGQGGVFAVGSSGRMQHVFWNGSAWQPIEDLGENVAGPCVAVGHASGMNIFALGLTGEVQNKWKTRSQWSSDWQNLGGNLFAPFTALLPSASEIHLLGVGADRTMVHKYWEGPNWFTGPDSEVPWSSLGGSFTGAMTAIVSGDRIYVYGIGLDGALHTQWWDGTSWNGVWESRGGVDLVHVSAVAGANGRQDLLAVDSDGALFHKRWDGGVWDPSETGWNPVT